MNLDLWTLILQSINALVLIWLLKRFLFKPVSNMIHARQQTANELLDDAQDALSAAESERDKARQALAKQHEQHTDFIRKATAEATTIKGNMIAKAEQEAAAVLDRASTERRRLQRQSDRATRAQATTLALEIAEKLLARLPDSARTAGFIDALIDALHTLSDSEKTSLVNDGGEVQLRSARALTAGEHDQCTQALTRVLGEAIDVVASVDSSLIAGVELVGSHVTVRNSLRADLVRLNDELVDAETSFA